MPVGIVVEGDEVGVEENPDPAHNGDDHGEHHDDAKNLTDGITVVVSLLAMHLDVPLLSVVVRMHLGIDLMLTVSRQVSLDSLNGVGGKSISVPSSNKM